MKTLLVFIAAAAIIGLIQMFLFNRIKIKVLKYIPAILFAGGLVFCFLLYVGVFGTGSPSVVAENQYFAMFLAVPLGGGLMGGLLGSL